MERTIFATGKPQSLNAVLTNRDQRVVFQSQLMKRYPKAAIMTIKLNTPGPIKNNNQLQRLFTTGLVELHENYFSTIFEEVIFWELATGPEAFWVINQPAKEVKLKSVKFEEKFALGRLFDVDVLFKGQAISRRNLNIPARQCLICNHFAKDCARSRQHSVAVLQLKISQMYQDYFQHEN